mmetsp:Transcript_14930/g.56678  ORF Transcript_14930/g.56678 Transcript_14930/m.56678 type:complete len:262 (-) Transcript_14930:2190-2975(-)
MSFTDAGTISFEYIMVQSFDPWAVRGHRLTATPCAPMFRSALTRYTYAGTLPSSPPVSQRDTVSSSTFLRSCSIARARDRRAGKDRTASSWVYPSNAIPDRCGSLASRMHGTARWTMPQACEMTRYASTARTPDLCSRIAGVASTAETALNSVVPLASRPIGEPTCRSWGRLSRSLMQDRGSTLRSSRSPPRVRPTSRKPSRFSADRTRPKPRPKGLALSSKGLAATAPNPRTRTIESRDRPSVPSGLDKGFGLFSTMNVE